MLQSMFLRMASFAVAAVMLLSSLFVASKSYDVRDPEDCKLNFSILSDSHIESNNLTRYRVFADCVRDVTKLKSGNDAVVFLGDNTMNGQELENMLFHGTARLFLKDQTVLPVVGNHDVGNGEGDYQRLQNRWYAYAKAAFGLELDRPYYYKVIDGYYFIVLGMEDQLVYEMTVSEAQFAWLKGVLFEAEKSGKPVFVFSHYPPNDALDEDGKETDRLIKMLAAYNKKHDLFYFCGHTHMPLLLFWSFHTDDGFPVIYLPRLTELGGETDNGILESTGVGVETEVYADHVLVRGRNFYTGEWYIDPIDDVLCEQSYALKHPIQAQ